MHLPAGRGHSDCSVSSFSLGHFYGRLIYGALDRYSGRAPDGVAIGFECTCRSPGPRIYPIPYCASSWQSCINNWTHDDDDDDELNDANAIPAPGCYLLVAVPSRVRACVVARAGSSAITPLLVRGREGALCTGGPDGKRRHRIPVPGRPATVRRGTPSSACPPRDHPSVVCTVWVGTRSTMPPYLFYHACGIAGSIIAALQGYYI
jgi:hypothetical protein